jgi:hypothetical protein
MIFTQLGQHEPTYSAVLTFQDDSSEERFSAQLDFERNDFPVLLIPKFDYGRFSNIYEAQQMETARNVPLAMGIQVEDGCAFQYYGNIDYKMGDLVLGLSIDQGPYFEIPILQAHDSRRSNSASTSGIQ